jgi:glutathione synthase/RimK-type ligase-like ATP-grasp enzyme
VVEALGPASTGHGARVAAGGSREAYDVLVLDAAFKQSLASVRSLGRAGLRVAAAECFAECDPRLPVAGFRSGYSSLNQILPSYVADASAYGAAIVDFVHQHPTRVVLPTMDGSIATLMHVRDQLADLDCTVALAPNSALAVANDKDRTLAVADRLDISYPRTLRIDRVQEVPNLLAEFEFPFVLKPTISWAAHSAVRLAPIEVVSKDEVLEVASKFLAAGVGVLGQQWVSGRREGITMFLDAGEIIASCAHATLRTTPALGGASVLRQSIPIPSDLLDSSVRLARTIGLDGICEVEYRRDKDGHPFLMEINARLAGTIKNALHSGVDFPLMVWKWATGQPLARVDSYKTGVRTRWLRGDIRWLRDNSGRTGRPDSVPRMQALQMFALEFVRTHHYDSVAGLDFGPVIGELQTLAAAARKARAADGHLRNAQSQGAPHVT